MTLSGTASAGIACILQAEPDVFLNFTPCTTFGAVLTIPNSISIRVDTWLDDAPLTETYIINATSTSTSSASHLIAISASVGAVFVAAIAVVAVAYAVHVKRSRAQASSVNFYTSDNAPLWEDARRVGSYS